ncbi:MAG: cytochrome P460 family protein [Gemmatimonadota bacterium]
MEIPGRILIGTMSAAVMFVSACGGEQTDAMPEAGSAEEAPAPSEAWPASSLQPDTTGAAIWTHLHENDYESWATWPEMGELYEGQEPHGAQLTTRLNDVAAEALAAGSSSFPEGSLIVKENYMPDGSLGALTTMYKVPGYNPEEGDWFYTKHLANGELDQMNGMSMEGRVPGCVGCHQSVADNDYVFTGELGR